MKYIWVIILILSISGCKWFSSAATPFFAWTNIKIPKGTPIFQKGFRDGCSTTVYSRGNYFYRMRYNYAYDPDLIDNSEYRFGHKRGYNYCFQQVNSAPTGPTGSFDKHLFQYEYDTTFDAADVNDTWDGFFKGGLDAPIRAYPANGFDSMFNVWSGGHNKGVLSANPLWAGGSKKQFFGWGYDGYNLGDK